MPARQSDARRPVAAVWEAYRLPPPPARRDAASLRLSERRAFYRALLQEARFAAALALLYARWSEPAAHGFVGAYGLPRSPTLRDLRAGWRHWQQTGAVRLFPAVARHRGLADRMPPRRIQSVRQIATAAAGGDPVPVTNSFRLLAQRVVTRRTYGEIAEEARRTTGRLVADKGGVHHAIRRLATRLDVTLPAVPPGRPARARAQLRGPQRVP